MEKWKDIQDNGDEPVGEPSINEEESTKYELSDKDRDKLTKKYHELCESWVAKDVAMKTAETMKNRAESDAERLKEQSETMRKCLKISRSMSKGLRIPPSDEQYLMEKNIGMY